jgi:hypothetical protein
LRMFVEAHVGTKKKLCNVVVKIIGNTFAFVDPCELRSLQLILLHSPCKRS